ncbi:MAG: ABC transporter ATP-binding protein [Planctomycetes bacterium]|nr:ABC transporter ATP-binding protein [Planctomycetota bacterium]
MTSQGATATAALSFEAVEKAYGGVRALRAATFEVPAGSMAMLIGPSGSGKSTLLHLAAGLDRADAGRVRVFGADLATLDARALVALRRREVGLIFQFNNLLPTLRLVENVEYTALIRGDAPRVARARALAVLEELNMSAAARRFPGQLSGGERQRGAIARCLAAAPRIVLADEPSAHLDGENAQQLFALLGRISREHGTTILAATHDLRVLAHATARFEIRDGHVHRSEP